MRNAYLDDLKDMNYGEAVKQERKEVDAMPDQPLTANDLGMWIPSLPEGWMVHGLQNYYVDGISKWKATVYRPMGRPSSSCAVGQSPREAVLRALDLRELENV